jgi:O-acetyl-ADP-ribose deacetylase (regulator of RNase III)
VIHTVGPVYSGSPDPDGELASAYTRSIEEARRVGAASIAFPAISTGVYGFPKHLAARVVARTLAHIVTAQPAPTVDLVYFSVADAELFVTETEHHVPELERD